MNVKRGTFLIFNVLFVTMIALFFCMTVFSANEENRIIQTYGEAEISAQPDLVKLSLSIETQSKLAKEAVEENARLANNVLTALMDFGISKENIKTSSYSLNSYRKWENKGSENEQELIYYQSFNEIIINTPDIEKVGKILDLAVQAGANNINYINFELNDPQELMLLALTRATEQAHIKAKAIAHGAGIEIKGLYSIREQRSSYAPFRFQDAMFARDMVAAASPTPISAGSVIINASILADFIF